VGLLARFTAQGSSNLQSQRAYKEFLLYLTALASSEVAFTKLVKLAGETRETFGELAEAFRKLDLLTDKWKYARVKACRIMAGTVKNPFLQTLFRKLSQTLTVGVPVGDFLKAECEKFTVDYEREYERCLGRLRTFGEAYSAILTSAAFISVTLILCLLMYGGQSPIITLFATLAAISATIGGTVYLIFINAPPNRVPHTHSKIRPKKLTVLEKAARPLLFAALPTASIPTLLRSLGLLDLSGAVSKIPLLQHLFPTPIFFAATGIPLLLVGMKGRKMVKLIKDMDEEYPFFIKAVGSALATVSPSMDRAVESVLTTDFGPLNPLIRKTHKRLKMRMNIPICWRYFAWETGSDIITKYTEIFHTAIGYGSKPEELTTMISEATMKDLVLRKKRLEVAGYIKGLLVPLQGALTAVLALMKSLLQIFSTFSAAIAGYITIMTPIPAVYMDLYFAVTILVLTFGNAATLYLLERESTLTLNYYLGIFLVVAGAVYAAMSIGTEAILRMFASLGEELSELTPGG